ncbi:hypothetical protein D3C81_706500 [compost metagenome]
MTPALKEFQAQPRTNRTGQRVYLQDLKPEDFPKPPPPVFNNTELNVRYSSTRLGKKSYVWLVDIKKDKVRLKRCLDAKDSFSESRAHFERYFVLDKE